MCEVKPGPRCAADTASGASAALDVYELAYPAGPAVNPDAAATVTMGAQHDPPMWVEDQNGRLLLNGAAAEPSDEFDPHVPGIPGDGSPVVLDVDEERGLTFTWNDISRRRQDWSCRKRGYLVSQLV